MAERRPLQARNVEHLAAVNHLTDPPADNFHELGLATQPITPDTPMVAMTPGLDIGLT